MPQVGSFFKEYPLILPLYAALLGALMVSKVPYLHAGRFLMTIRHNRKRLIATLLLLLAVIIFRLPGLAVIVTLYVLSGPVIGIYNLVIKKGPQNP